MTPLFFKTPNGGFSLIELMVVLAISTMVSVIAIVGSSRFNGTVLLTNLAYEIAFSIREAQSFGLNVREFQPGTESATFNAGYGVHFFKDYSNGAPNTADYITFADLVVSAGAGDFTYDGDENGGPEFVAKYTTKKGNFIEKFCGIKSNNEEKCSNESGGLAYLDIVFLRPDPDATFTSNTGVLFRAAKIYVKSPQGGIKAVKVENTGQVTVCGAGGC